MLTDPLNKPYSQAAENNKPHILAILSRVFADADSVLEIGSGTGQHAVYFAAQMPWLKWQTADLIANHPGINAWLEDEPQPNLLPPLELQASTFDWSAKQYGGIYSANTAHIMAWPEVEAMFAGVGQALKPGGCFCLYGPMKYHGQFTTESNANFDMWLKEQAPHMGIRDIEALNTLAENATLTFVEDNPMPANNQLVVWKKN